MLNILIYYCGVKTDIEYFNILLKSETYMEDFDILFKGVNLYRIFWYPLEECKVMHNILIYS